MSKKFENPQGTFSEEISLISNIGVLFFGPIALALFSLWAHFVMWVLVVMVAMSANPILGFSAYCILTIFYTVTVGEFRAKKYLRDGWREISANGTSRNTLKSSDTKGRVQDKETKKCPFCAEEIRIEAIKCKHCGSDLSTSHA